MDISKHIVFLFLTFVSLSVFGQIFPKENSYESATAFIKSHLKEQNYTIISQEELFFKNTEKLSSYIFNLHPQGFIVISADAKHVLAYSFENNMAIEGSNYFEVLSSFINALSVKENLVKLTLADNIEDQSYGPYVYNLWGQVNCYNQTGETINVTNLFTPHNYAVGCVAISQASIMKHYNWPPKGVSSKSYYDNRGSSTGTHSADFVNEIYDWKNALDRYKGKTSTQAEREAAGKAVFHAAVSLEMDFEYNGSTSNVSSIPAALASHFRFTALYKYKSSSTFWPLLDSNMVWARPVVLAIGSSSGAGHSIICDGLKIENGTYYYHLNMGWWGSSNGWYQIRGGFNAGGYNSIVGAAMNILPEPLVENPSVLDNESDSFLYWSYPEKGNADAFEVQRSVDGVGWETLSNTVVDTQFAISPQNPKTYKYRVRAMTNSRWYANSWSQEVELNWTYEGIDDQSLAKLKIYPSPFSSDLNIHLPENKNVLVQVDIYNQQGLLLFHKQTNSALELNINTVNWKVGVYIIHILYGNDSRVSKIIKI